ncbi:YhfX family PLP-dependent enzyme [Vagococcus xieshaowenii]|uniref:YhfX family PLP-dependent enzyme n=1 Tax=Vagococcus xieshaowenii TaxID=2562451 RepID=A0AAJ5EH66_9ENTE|nr:YhfX family PLP-dependent enzyme [Vagococcus xieshaowenii]QCA28871.1 YhfX family PLP-dependent enzyme [Vagococcus xieshaowenii]TFZ43288.1 YhfX family PLP-dependent enzyme [Vagococcus xieshaowenii]
MFLELTKRRNPKLIEAASQLHKQGLILPDTYVLDLDMITHNAKVMKEKADKYKLELFYMTKQFGRNPLVSRKIVEAGISHAVVVDFKEALIMMEHNLPIGNVGHLVQVPKNMLERIIAYGPKFITVFSNEMLNNINTVAQKLNKVQQVLIKVVEPTDEIYEGQFGGYHLEDLEELIAIAKKLDNIKIAGITSFPCFLFDGEKELKPTNNVKTINTARNIFKKHGIEVQELNIPSATCCTTIPLIKGIQGTQGEPGHALTGTTPLHAKLDLEELPSMVYVSEISHSLDGHSYFYGGGYYRRGHLENILVIDKDENYSKDTVAPFGNESIDYYLESNKVHPVGSTVIAAFRTQVFVTRSDVAVVSGISSGTPKLEGIYNSLGNLIRR